jgi:hypothetical protein
MRAVSSLSNHVFDQIFGTKLLSLRAVTVSFWLSLASAVLAFIYIGFEYDTNPPMTFWVFLTTRVCD